jgi:hypothetical protein
MAAMTNGATQMSAPSASSTMGLLPEGWRGPVKPGVSANGSRSRSSTPGSLAAAASVALRLAAVPPEKVPFILRTRPRTRFAGWPKRAFISVCSRNTPRSNGIESKPHENTMRAPLAFAWASCASIMRRIQAGSPHRST